jgi:hypothetical protein
VVMSTRGLFGSARNARSSARLMTHSSATDALFTRQSPYADFVEEFNFLFGTWRGGNPRPISWGQCGILVTKSRKNSRHALPPTHA